jgi:FHA domain/Domain of unknown function (DUF4388)
MTTEPQPLSLGGSLSDFPFADVLTFLNMERSTGAIEVISGSQTSRIYLEAGQVVWAFCRAPRFALPDFLTARGLMTERMASELGVKSEMAGIPFARFVVDSGLIDVPELDAIQKVLCSEIVFHAMRLGEGKFAFLKDRRPPDDVPSLRIGIENLILEGARRFDEAARFKQELNVERNLIVTLTLATERLEDELALTPLEWGVVALINGKRMLEEIFALSPTGSEAETWTVMQRLQAARMIRFDSKDGAGDDEPPSVRDVLETAQMSRYAAPQETPGPVLAASGDGKERDRDRDKTDVRLLVSDEVTTSRAMFGRRLPARLVGELGHGYPVSIELSRPVLTVGRSDGSDIVLPDPSVSKHHAQIEQAEDGWRLTDLKSTNGTWVNGQKVDDRQLMPGDQVRFGVYKLTFEVFSAF